jgi:hypothetical protein
MVPTIRIGRARARGWAPVISACEADAGPASPCCSDVESDNHCRRLTAALCTLLIVSGVALGVLCGSAPSLASLSTSSPKAATSKRSSVSPIQPTSIALVGSGLYIADPGRQQILERLPTGAFSVVAGTGAPGLSGDGGPARRAKIDNPAHLVALKSGALLFEQARPGSGSLIREVTPAGVIRTVAGLRPSCAGITPNATSIAAELANLHGVSLSIDADGLALLGGAQPCPLAHHLGPFLKLTPAGKLTNAEMDTPSLTDSTLVSCGSSAVGPGFTAFLCESGAGHPKRLLVLRKDRTSKSYPTFGSGALASESGKVVATRNDSIVRVASQRLRTLASAAALKRLVPHTSVVSVIDLAVAANGDVFAVTDHIGHEGCTAVISELRPADGPPHILWSRLSRHCY